MKKIVLILGLCCIAVMSFAFGSYICAQEISSITFNESGSVIQKTPDGTVDWSKGVISAVGFASADQPPAAQKVAAGAIARANLLKVLGEVTIQRGITVEQGKLKGDLTIERIEGALSGSFLGRAQRQPDGTLAVAAYKKISPELMSAILPEIYFEPAPDEKLFEVEQPAPVVEKPVVEKKVVKAEIPSYTGLIVDAKGLGVMPSLGCRILVDGTDEVVYGLSSSKRMAVIEKRGMAGYARTVENAKTNARVGKNPLIVKAAKASGERKTDVYISKENAKSVYGANVETSFLKDLKVMVVCGR